jgi:hypothetical protein
MASLKSAYGDNYKTQTENDYENYSLNIISNNISNNEYSIKIDTFKLWNEKGLNKNFIVNLINSIKTKNPFLRLVHIERNSNNINIFPVLFPGNAEYFVLIDTKNKKFISLYLTPENMEAL